MNKAWAEWSVKVGCGEYFMVVSTILKLSKLTVKLSDMVRLSTLGRWLKV